MIILSYTVNRLVACVNNAETVIRVHQDFEDLQDGDSTHYIGQKGVNIGFGVGKADNFALHNYLQNQSLFDISIEEYRMEFLSQNSSYVTTSYEVGHEVCSIDGFDYPEALIKAFNLDSFYCPSNKNYKIQGSASSSVFNFLNITVSKCKDKSF